MTIAFGFSYQSSDEEMASIILASDSRISDGYHASTNNEHKVVSVMFQGDHPVLLAKAGIKTTSDAFEEKFAEIAAATPVTGLRSIPDAAEVAIRDVISRLNACYEGDRDKRIADYESQFILGFWYAGKPCFYTLGLQGRIAHPSNDEFVSIGHASNLADVLLASVNRSNLCPAGAFELAGSLVEMCKLRDGSCGGAPQIGILLATHPTLPADIFTYVYADAYMKAVKAHSEHAYLIKRFAANFTDPPT